MPLWTTKHEGMSPRLFEGISLAVPVPAHTMMGGEAVGRSSPFTLSSL